MKKKKGSSYLFLITVNSLSGIYYTDLGRLLSLDVNDNLSDTPCKMREMCTNEPKSCLAVA